MHWILQNNLFNESAYQELLSTLERFNIPHSVHKVIPFIGELTPEPGQLIPCQPKMSSETICEYGTKGCIAHHKNVICMGSYSLRHSADKYGWTPGVFDLEPFDFRVQLEKWGEHMLNHDSVVCRFEDAYILTPAFIRPIHDSKTFAGKIMDKQEFEEWQVKVCLLKEDYGTTLDRDTLIQVGVPKKIFSEHRFWVVKGKIVTSSTYKLGRTVIYQPLPADSMFQKFAEERIAEWQPHEAFVIDIADTEEGLKVVEINTLNSCGFYACDMQKLVMALEDAFNEN